MVELLDSPESDLGRNDEDDGRTGGVVDPHDQRDRPGFDIGWHSSVNP